MEIQSNLSENPINKQNSSRRDSRFELLRIIAMLLIIMHHFAYHGGYSFKNAPSLNRAVYNIFIIGGKFGVNLFMLISGYFLSLSRFKFRKAIKLIVQVFFYSAVIYLIFVLSGRVKFNINQMFKDFLPTITNRYWFVSCYVITYALSPFINKMLNGCKMREHAVLIVILVFLHSVLTYFGYSYVNNTTWFITLYIVGGFLKKYDIKPLANMWISLAVFIFAYGLIIIHKVYYNYSRMYIMNDIVCFIAAVSLFNTFKCIKTPFYSKTINFISASTFGVYLIHDNNYIRYFLWQDLLKCPKHITSELFPLFAVGAVIVVFIVCTLIDLFRRFVLEKPFFALVDWVIKKGQNAGGKPFKKGLKNT